MRIWSIQIRLINRWLIKDQMSSEVFCWHLISKREEKAWRQWQKISDEFWFLVTGWSNEHYSQIFVHPTKTNIGLIFYISFWLRIPFLVIHGSAKINGPCCHDFYIMMIESDSSSEQDLRHDVNSQTRQQSNELYTAFLQQIE